MLYPTKLYRYDKDKYSQLLTIETYYERKKLVSLITGSSLAYVLQSEIEMQGVLTRRKQQREHKKGSGRIGAVPFLIDTSFFYINTL